MRIRPTLSLDGKIQFIINADNDSDGIILGQFAKEQNDPCRDFTLHGYTKSTNSIGVTSFNFGTKEKK